MVLARDSCSFFEVSIVETHETTDYRTLRSTKVTMVAGIGLARAMSVTPAKPLEGSDFGVYEPVTAVTYPLDGVTPHMNSVSPGRRVGCAAITRRQLRGSTEPTKCGADFLTRRIKSKSCTQIGNCLIASTN